MEDTTPFPVGRREKQKLCIKAIETASPRLLFSGPLAAT